MPGFTIGIGVKFFGEGSKEAEAAFRKIAGAAQQTSKSVRGIEKDIKVVGRGVRDFKQAAAGLLTLFGGTQVLTAPYRILADAIRDATKASESATLAQKRVDESIKGIYATVGNQLAPALNQVSEEITKAFADPEMQKGLQAIGTYLSTFIEGLGGLVKLAGSEGFQKLLKFIEASALRAVGGAESAEDAVRKLRALDQYNTIQANANKLAEEWMKKNRETAAAEKKLADERKRSAEQFAKEVKALIDQFDPYGAAQRKAAEQTALLNKAFKDKSGAEYLKLLKAIDDQLKETLASVVGLKANLDFADLPTTDRFGGVIAESAGPDEPFAAIEIRAKTIGDILKEEWVANGRVFASIIGTLDPKFSHLAHAALDIADAFKVASDSSATMAQKLEAAAATGAAIFDIGKQMGLWTGDKGIGKFGAQLSGDYADIGAQVGAVIGAIVVGYFTAGAGAGWGAAVGSVVGGMLGSAIKKGADEGLGQLELAASEAGNRIITGITKAEAGLGTAIRNAGEGISAAVNDIVTLLGGELESIPLVSFKIRDDIVSVWVNGFKQSFKEMGDAVSFAIAEILKRSEISGIDEMLASALKSTTSDNLEQLQSDLEAIQKVINFGFTESQVAVQAFVGELDVLRGQMLRLVTDSDQLARALGNIAQEEIRRWQSSRDAITGDKKSNAEKLELLKADAQMWNAEKALRLAELTLKRDAMAAQIEIVKAGGTLNSASVIAQANFLQTKAELYEQELRLGGAHLEGLAALDQAAVTQLQIILDATNLVIGALENMPDIDIPSLRLPELPSAGGGGPSGPSHADQVRAILDEINAVRESLTGQSFQQRLAAIRAQFDGFRERLTALGETVVDLTLLETQAIQQLRDEAIDSLGLPMESLRDRIATLSDTIEFLGATANTGAGEVRGVTAEMDRMADIMAQLTAQASSEMLGLAIQLAEAFGLDQQAADFRRQMAEAELAFKVIELQFLYEQYMALGLIGGALSEQLKALLTFVTDPANWPDFGSLDFPPPPQFGGGGADADPWADRRNALQQALDRLRSAIDNLREFEEGLELSELSPMTIEQQFGVAQSQYQQLLAAAQAGDLAAIEGLPAAAQAYLELAAQMFDSSGAGYAAIFQLIQQQLAGIVTAGQGVLDAVPPMQGTEQRLDTIAQILHEMAVLMGVTPGWNPFTGGGNANVGSQYAPSATAGGQMSTSSGGTIRVSDPEVAARLARLESKIERQNVLIHADTMAAKQAAKKRNTFGARGFEGADPRSQRAG